ncbi:hypothetical protein NA57DRAFT_75292 [Rhizodiscina lignyota]|uniref:Uncharacterized protein n=1 Tax=Rhizodiscina lignyota TaxID=1504668 RepID=A0A9P4IHK7_9PEZI|nr:hypothetical protein NA57DRAFT_75292 [Rhizodiscina lignyota]
MRCLPFATFSFNKSPSTDTEKATMQTTSEKSDAISTVKLKDKAGSKNEEKHATPGVSYYSFETSAKQIHSRRGKILTPAKSWTNLDSERDAEKFVRTTPIRNATQNFAQSRFRILVVRYSDHELLYAQKSLLEAAKAAGWISNVFETFIANHTVGSAVRDSKNGMSFMIQTPHDDIFPFFSLSLASHHGYGYENAPDWTALVFIGSYQSSDSKHELDIDVVSSLLNYWTYPIDYPPSLSPDFMILPVAMMRYQVNEIATGVAKMRKEILNVDDKLLNSKMHIMKRMGQVKAQLFRLRRMQGSLHQRYLFAKELATNLEKAFETLRKRGINEPGEPSIKYSGTLTEAVQAHSFILETLKHEVTGASPRIESQQTTLDGETNIIIANNSYLAAEEARRDSASMKTIAVVTLVFLPGTFVAAIFSMSMFQWISQGGGSDSSQVLSGWFWLYWAVTVPLTVVILIVWIIWYRWTDKRYKVRRDGGLDEESKVE